MSKKRVNFAVLQNQFNAAADGTIFREIVSGIASRLLTLITGDGSAEKPDPPENLQAFLNSNGVSTTVLWNTVDGAASYNLYVQVEVPGGANDPFEFVGTTTLNNFVHGDLSAGTYIYTVTAVSAIGRESDESEYTSVVVTGGSAGSPTAPTNFAVTASTQDSADLTWDALTADTESVRIERAIGATSVSFSTVLSGVTGTSVSDTPVLPGVTYRYRAYGVTGSVEDGPTPIVNVTIPAGDTTPPPIPTNLISEPRNTAIRVQWDAIDTSAVPDFSHYDISVSQFSGLPAGGILTENFPNNTILLTGLQNDTQYYVSVRSEDTSGNESDWSVEISETPTDPGSDTTPPDPVGTVNVTNTGDYSLTYFWEPSPSPDAVSYKIYTDFPPNATGNGPWVLQSTPPVTGQNPERLSFSNLTYEEPYYLYVVAVDAAGNESVPSNVASATPTLGADPPDPDPPGGFTGDTANSSTDGITAQTTAGSTVQLYQANNASENKELFQPGMRASRDGARTQVDSGQTHPDTAAWPSTTTTIKHLLAFGSQWDRSIDRGGSITPPTRTEVPIMDDWGFSIDSDDYIAYTRNWYNRRYNLPGSITVDCDFYGDLVPQYIDEPWFDENGEPVLDSNGIQRTRKRNPGVGDRYYPSVQNSAIHDSMAGPIVLLNTTVRNSGSGLLLQENRPFHIGTLGPSNAPHNSTKPNPLALVSNCHAIDCNQTDNGFALAFYDFGDPTYQSTIIVRNSSFVSSWPYVKDRITGEIFDLDDPNGPTGNRRQQSGKMFICTQNIFNGSTKAAPDDFGNGVGNTAPSLVPSLMDYPVKKLVFDNCLFDYTGNSGFAIQIDGVEEIIFEDCMFIGRERDGIIEINIGREGRSSRNCKPCGTATLRNCAKSGSFVLRFWTGPDVMDQVVRGIDTIGITRTYNCATGDLIGDAFTPFSSPSEGYVPSVDINAAGGFSGLDIGSYTIDYGINGVTVDQ